jgi:hypothetical protein
MPDVCFSALPASGITEYATTLFSAWQPYNPLQEFPFGKY